MHWETKKLVNKNNEGEELKCGAWGGNYRKEVEMPTWKFKVFWWSWQTNANDNVQHLLNQHIQTPTERHHNKCSLLSLICDECDC
jgi:hypothetical protein